MTWGYGPRTVEHPLPVGAARLAPEGTVVRAGDVIASGATVTRVLVVSVARRVGVEPGDLDRVLRVRPVADVARNDILARTGRTFTRAAASPIDGRLVHITIGGDACIAPVVDDWRVRSAIDGIVARSDAAALAVEGECWALAGLAAYGPDALGVLAVAVDGPADALAPSRIDVLQKGRILVGGARAAAEAITRAHACGVSGVVVGAAPAGGLRVVYGDDLDARGLLTFDDRPTVLCLIGFGSAELPREIFDPLASFAGQRASIHVASASLFVMAPATAARLPAAGSRIALADDHASVRIVDPEAASPEALALDADR
ncbi:MAG: hypothetical protein HYX56_04395 [Chloroflexi bacterium]|nr:hypothetical protein [Chloroflexota bacterium]